MLYLTIWSRFGVYLIIITISVTLVSCASANRAEQKLEADTSEFVTINYVIIGDPPSNDHFDNALKKVNEIMKEKINAELVWQWTPWAEMEKKYYGLLKSGEPLDLITVSTDWLGTWDYAAQDSFLPLDDLLPKYAPQTYKSISKADWLKSTYNGKIVLIPENDYTQWVNHGFFYRGDWAKEAGITAPITDFAAMGRYLQYVKDHKPGVVPWDTGVTASAFGGYVESNTDMLYLPLDTGFLPLFWAQSYANKYEVGSPVFTDKFVDFAKLMKQWGDLGFWRDDVLVGKPDTHNLLIEGLSGAFLHHTNTYKGVRVEMDKELPGSELQMFPFSATRKNLLEMSVTHGGTSVGAHSKHPERALMAYDLLRNNEQIFRLINYGIEGVDYVFKNGKRYDPPGYDVKRAYFNPNFWGGRVDKFILPHEADWDKISQLYAEYDTYKKPYPYGQFTFDKSGIETELSALAQITNEWGPAIAMGKAGDPVKAVENLRSKLRAAGYEKVLAESQRQMDEYKEYVEKLVESQK